MIPEFGCLYIKHVVFFEPPQYNRYRTIDIVAGACYDLTGRHGLYIRPNSNEKIAINTRKKFETIIASAQANSNGNGRDTYLLLGPIGSGACQNNIQTIARLWADVLLKPLNEQTFNLHPTQRL